MRNTYKDLQQWYNNGKIAAQFDHKWMGLFMISAPTQEFGWDGISQTIKIVSILKV
jgi:hypothetical protein